MKYEYKSFFTFLIPLLIGLIIASVKGYYQGIPLEFIWISNLEAVVAMLLCSGLISIFWNVRRMYKIINRVYQNTDIMKVEPKLRKVKFEDTFD